VTSPRAALALGITLPKALLQQANRVVAHVKVLVLFVLLACGAAFAQTPQEGGGVRRIGVLAPTAAAEHATRANHKVFTDRLREHGRWTAPRSPSSGGSRKGSTTASPCSRRSWSARRSR
jgi:hypothetical protein